jgi:hypothetical protein
MLTTIVGSSAYTRSARRFALQAPVIITWTDSAGSTCRLRGTSRDLSAWGVYVLSDQCPPRDLLVSVELRVPTRDGAGIELHVCANGRVIRIDRVGAGWGFAVLNQKQFSFHRADPQLDE